MSEAEGLDCEVCGSAGSPLYTDLQDLWFGVPGKWSLCRCTADDCQLAWLSPRPQPDAIAAHYADYYTHAPAASEAPPAPASDPVPGVLTRVLQSLHGLAGLQRARDARSHMYLPRSEGGRLLELGCGSGARLLKFRARGWQVEGQDVDPKAVAAASALTGATVHLGEVHRLDLAPGRYDAVVMNHVLEHVADPRTLLDLCVGLLRPGGQLVCAVPNIDGAMARHFGADWWGIDAPRHLYHFSPKSLQKLATSCHLQGATIWTTVCDREHWLAGSYFMQRRRRGVIPPGGRLELLFRLRALAGQYAVWAKSLINHTAVDDDGDECVLHWRKP